MVTLNVLKLCSQKVSNYQAGQGQSYHSNYSQPPSGYYGGHYGGTQGGYYSPWGGYDQYGGYNNSGYGYNGGYNSGYNSGYNYNYNYGPYGYPPPGHMMPPPPMGMPSTSTDMAATGEVSVCPLLWSFHVTPEPLPWQPITHALWTTQTQRTQTDFWRILRHRTTALCKVLHIH